MPVTILVVLLHIFLTPLEGDVFERFLLGAVFIILGLTVFLIGVEIAISPVGNAIGNFVVRRESLFILVAAGVVLGFSINIAEPDLLVLAKQIATATGETLGVAPVLVVVSLGVGIMLAVGLLRIVFQIPLKNFLFIIYAIILVLSYLAPNNFLGIAFDAGGATTGSMTVPFILALGLGVSSVSSKKSEEDAFGLTAIASGGPMLAVMIMALASGLTDIVGDSDAVEETTTGIFLPFLETASHIAREVFIAILPLVVITILAQHFALKLPKRSFRHICVGFVYTYLGFVLFLTGVNAGFMEAGTVIGMTLAHAPLITNVLVGAVIGLVVILAEPSVHVLTEQIEEISGGTIHKNSILVSFAIGVSLAIVMSVLRLRITDMQLWHLLLVGYLIAIILSRFTPPLFVGIAFDSGGVASGPMTATFVLAFAQGIAAESSGSASVLDAFGVIAMVALTPLITLQIFGLIYERKRRRLYEQENATTEEEEFA